MKNEENYEVQFRRDLTQIHNTKPKLFAKIENRFTGEKIELSSYDPNEINSQVAAILGDSEKSGRNEVFENILQYALASDYSNFLTSLKYLAEFVEPDPYVDLDRCIKQIPIPDNRDFLPAREKQIAELKAAFDEDHIDWEMRRKLFYQHRNAANETLDLLMAEYHQNIPESVTEYFRAILEASKYPTLMYRKVDLEYNPTLKSVVVDFLLPNPDQIPKFFQTMSSKGEVKVTEHSAANKKRLYDSIVYQIVFRVIHEVYASDIANLINGVTFNGWVSSIDRTTGKPAASYIASLHVLRAEFANLDLNNIDPKACFKALKGIGSSEFSSTTPIQPIVAISRSDRRFIDGKQITKTIENSTNLAAMDWEDFEHLIREIFEAEFRTNGGEVKVTQASRDGGVDAIAFDPDPIRGGKIIIQAKRYTNTVGVSSVRDLFGTVMSEGATKGILVTTSDYGPDAHAFAKGKPLTLLNGANLLYLLEKHGHKARIDIQEAKALRKGTV